MQNLHMITKKQWHVDIKTTWNKFYHWHRKWIALEQAENPGTLT